MTETDDKIIIENPRIIYSLAMTAILFEIYNSGILISQGSLMINLNLYILLLILCQIIFLGFCGISLAGIKSEKEKIKKDMDWLYTYLFQASAIIGVVLVSVSITDIIFNFLEIPKTLYYRLLYFLIFLVSIILGMYLWNRYFIITTTKKNIYLIMMLWMVVGFFIIIFL